ncbi:3-keto-5-aminohexanoate cleavage protein [Halomonas sp. IOP_14]|uniref:hypothetical protein n=1 Tax=Halomonadaceae TaxID=28256 RepID=UPI001AD64648|nr:MULTISPECIES: hypothetical protein [Halomonas]MCD1586479.1 3-keto-5-aminohexanoate cleavage protein [Halomonas sp. IOP_14]
MEKFIITAAVNSGTTSRRKNPNVSYTPEEVVLDVSNPDEARKAMGLNFVRAVA